MYFRKANLNDIDELVRLRVDFMKEVMGLDNEEKNDLDILIKKELIHYFKDNIKNNCFIAWLAIDNDRIIGTSGLCFYNRPPSYKNLAGKVAYIMNMYTVKDYRKQGIATVLFEKIVNEAKSKGYKNISLHATEMGRPVYLKYGFKETTGEMSLKI